MEWSIDEKNTPQQQPVAIFFLKKNGGNMNSQTSKMKDGIDDTIWVLQQKSKLPQKLSKKKNKKGNKIRAKMFLLQHESCF